VLTLVDGRRQRGLAMVTQLGQGSLMVWVAFSGFPATVKAPTGAVVLGEALGTVGLARMEVYRCDGERI
jgi:hypothetical protein